MVTEFDIDPKSIAIEIGPGLGPSCIEGYDPERDTLFSGTSYELGKEDAQAFIPGVGTNFSGYTSDENLYFSPEIFHYYSPANNEYFNKPTAAGVPPDERKHPINRPAPQLTAQITG